MTNILRHTASESTERVIPPIVIPRKPGILIADDMALRLTILKVALEPNGFVVWLAVDGDDALDLYRRNRADIDLVLLDVQLSGLDGPQTLAALQRIDPDVLACFMTENTNAYTRAELLERGAARVFDKSLVMAELVRSVHELLAAAARSDRWVRSRSRTHAIAEAH